MDTMEGEIVGDIHIVVCKTPDGYHFFDLQANTENVLPILDVIEDVLARY